MKELEQQIVFNFDKYGLKSTYVSLCNVTKPLFRSLELCSMFEAEINKDLCEFNFIQFRDLIVYLLQTNDVGTAGGYISHYKNYLDYCLNMSDKAVFTRKEIDKYAPRITKWLRELSEEETDYITKLVSLEDLVRIQNNREFSFQEIAVFWLLFIGFKVEDITNFKVDEIDQWFNKLEHHEIIPDVLIRNITSILKNASRQTYILRSSRNQSQYPSYFKNNNYLIRSDRSEDKPSSKQMLYLMCAALEKHLKKVKLDSVNLRKSGELYLACELLRINSIETVADLNQLVYKPISLLYKAKLNNNFSRSLNIILSSPVLKEFYGIELPNKLKHKIRSRSVDILLSPKINRPKERDENDKKPWIENKKQGDRGEKLVFLYLKDIRKEFPMLYFVKDSYGYDLYAEKDGEQRLIEVKTMQNMNCCINITKHEYYIAERFKEYYWFYILIDRNDYFDLYIFKDFLGVIGLSNQQEELFKIEKSKPVIWTHMDIRVYLNKKVFIMCDEYIKIPILI